MKGKYTQIPNKLLELLPRARLSATEYQIILIVLRKTLGFHKREDWISYSQIEKLTGKSHWAVWNAIRQLVRKTILVRKTKLGKTSVYRINRNTGEWNPLVRKTKLVRFFTSTSKENQTGLVRKTKSPSLYTKETYIKENTTKEINQIYSSYKKLINPNSRLTDKGRLKIKTRLKSYSAADLIKAMEKFSKNSWWVEHNAGRGVAWFFNSDDRIDQFLNLLEKRKEKKWKPKVL